jgi:hypothetical protein
VLSALSFSARSVLIFFLLSFFFVAHTLLQFAVFVAKGFFEQLFFNFLLARARATYAKRSRRRLNAFRAQAQ